MNIYILYVISVYICMVAETGMSIQRQGCPFQSLRIDVYIYIYICIYTYTEHLKLAFKTSREHLLI